MPPAQPTAMQVLLGSPHHTVLSPGPCLSRLHLKDRVCSCLFSQIFVECLLFAGCGTYRVSKTDVVWSTVKGEERKRSRLFSAIPLVSKYNTELDAVCAPYQAGAATSRFAGEETVTVTR